MQILNRNILCALAFIFVISVNGQQKNTVIEGVIFDENKITIPYAAITVQNKNIGTSSNEEGGFSFSIPSSNLNDSLFVSSIGFKTFKIKIKDFLSLKSKSIILIENVTSLATVEILQTDEYVKRALKSLKANTLSSRHQMTVLYRRTSVENNKSRLFVEHLVNVVNYGPSTEKFESIDVVEGRQSADYRFVKQKQPIHAIHIMASRDPLRAGIYIKKYKWKKVGESSYDNEDIVIVEGRKGNEFIKLYIGIDTYSIYKLETSDLNAIYVYKKNKDGKLYLSYHNREWITSAPLNEQQKYLLKANSNSIKVAYRHEAYVVDIETDRKKIKYSDNFGLVKDMGDIEVKYNPEFWSNFSVPPDSEFFKKIKSELESHFGVPLETQFKLVN